MTEVAGETDSVADDGMGWELHYTVPGFIHIAPFRTKRRAMRAYRALREARAAVRKYDNDGSALFELHSDIGSASVVLSEVNNFAVLNVAKSIARHQATRRALDVAVPAQAEA